jgi:hypothetical protein
MSSSSDSDSEEKVKKSAPADPSKGGDERKALIEKL